MWVKRLPGSNTHNFLIVVIKQTFTCFLAVSDFAQSSMADSCQADKISMVFFYGFDAELLFSQSWVRNYGVPSDRGERKEGESALLQQDLVAAMAYAKIIGEVI